MQKFSERILVFLTDSWLCYVILCVCLCKNNNLKVIITYITKEYDFMCKVNIYSEKKGSHIEHLSKSILQTTMNKAI